MDAFMIVDEGQEERDAIVRATIGAAVHKLFDAEECVGTFVFVAKDTGICPLHCVTVDGEVREESLRVQKLKVKLVRAFEKYDLAVFRALGRQGAYLELDSNAGLYSARPVKLASFPALDSQTQDDQDEEVLLTYGRICRCENASELVIAQYPCFPNSSGGAVVSEACKLVGLHIQALFYESHKHMGKDARLEDEDTKKVALFAASNVSEKGSLAEFLPVSVIRRKLQKLRIVKSPRVHYPKEVSRKRRKQQ